jgi:hypothetical protein
MQQLTLGQMICCCCGCCCCRHVCCCCCLLLLLSAAAAVPVLNWDCCCYTHLDILVIQWAVEALRVARILALLFVLQQSSRQPNNSEKL